ncbi:MAG: hypothetical protein U1F59_08650 [Candidatus Competibacteraceae bacterium]
MLEGWRDRAPVRRRRGKLLEALDKLRQEDPTCAWMKIGRRASGVLRGMGELHLQIACERPQEFNVNVRIGNPDVVTRETIVRRPRPTTCFTG